MNTTSLTADGLLEKTAEVVSVAAMQLPSLTHRYDADFLRAQTTKAIGIFWQTFTDMLPKDERASAHAGWRTAVESNDLGQMALWAEEHANVDEDPIAADRALAAFDQVAMELRASIQDDYRTFLATIALRN